MAASRRSDGRGGPSGGRGIHLARAALVLPVIGLVLASTPAPARDPDLEGEHGLWVEAAEGEVTVHWITGRHDAGLLKVQEGRRPPREFRTAPGASHSVTLPVRSDRLLIRYGSAADSAALHSTVLRLDPEPAPVSIRGADSIFVSADVHGEYDKLLSLLRNAGVVNPAGRWIAGRSHLVFLGDLMDRGPDVARVLWFVHGLEEQAARQGGRVHVLLGNHELMVMSGDLRYVHSKEARLAELHRVPYPRLYHPRNSVLGRWLASKPGVLRIGRVLFAHGGVSAAQRPRSLEAHRDSLRSFIDEELFVRWSDTTFLPRMDSVAFARRSDFFWGESSVFWHRGYVQSDTLAAELDSVLKALRGELLVVGHTPRPVPEERYGGRLIAAHPRTPATEMLLLVSEGGAGIRRYRIGPSGPPAAF